MQIGSKSPPFSCQVITRKVNIQVGDVNDNAPTFHNQPYSVRIPEVGAPSVTLEGHGVGCTRSVQGHLGIGWSWGKGSLCSTCPARASARAPALGRLLTMPAPLRVGTRLLAKEKGWW